MVKHIYFNHPTLHDFLPLTYMKHVNIDKKIVHKTEMHVLLIYLTSMNEH